MKQDIINPELKEKLIKLIHAVKPEVDIFLYGSRARGTAADYSDIDIALDSGKKIPSYDIMEIHDVLAGLRILYSIDVVDINSLDPHMRVAVDKEKLLWKKRLK